MENPGGALPDGSNEIEALVDVKDDVSHWAVFLPVFRKEFPANEAETMIAMAPLEVFPHINPFVVVNV